MKPFLMTEEKRERYTKKGYWGLPTLHEVFGQQAIKSPHKEFLVDSSTRLTFSQAQRYVDRLALGILELGFEKDNVLMNHLPNMVESALLRLAAPSGVILAVMVMAAFDAREIKHILQKTQA